MKIKYIMPAILFAIAIILSCLDSCASKNAQQGPMEPAAVISAVYEE